MVVALAICLSTAQSSHGQEQKSFARGPLRVHPTNPRYFTDGTKSADGSLRTVYLTGTHTWNNFQDLGPTDPPAAFDFDAYLDLLEKHHHNFIRLWRYELTKWKGWVDGPASIQYCTPHPWQRTGPGVALDGLPKFNFERSNEAYYDRLRSRVEAAGKHGIYVSIMLFEGWELRTQPTLWNGHLMNAANNVNGIDGNPSGDGRGLEVQKLQIDAITKLQQAYIRKIIDAVNDLDNVLYEISNESLYLPAIQNWQEQMVRYINEYQASKPKQHPTGITNLVAGGKEKIAANDALFVSPADWVSPGLTIWGPADPYSINPPATNGKKIEILDSDHTWNNACFVRNTNDRADQAWVWKSFVRGYHPIYMDPLELAQPNAVMEYAKTNAAAIVAARAAMGHTRLLAERINLAAATPKDALASSGFCLANPGQEYVIYAPDGKVSVDLSGGSGQFKVEWIHPTAGTIKPGVSITGGVKQQFAAPFAGDAVLRLSKMGSSAK